MDKKIVVIGGGPTGLGACIRLQQMGHKNWTLIDKSTYTGGLSGSFLDDNGFLWDVGGHVIFSHYNYFNDLIDQGVLAYAKHVKDRHEILPDDIDNLNNLWLTHKRESWVRSTTDSWISYPFQNNFFHLKDTKSVEECFEGLVQLSKTIPKKSNNYEELLNNLFGAGLCKHFMIPYSFKVWGYPANQMSTSWIGERVAITDLSKVLNEYVKHSTSENKNAALKSDTWGPNSVFKFPKYGGTGSIWKGVGHLLNKENVMLNSEVVEIDAEAKHIKLLNSNTIEYDYLINTMPIDTLLQKVIKPTKSIDPEALFSKYGKPKYSTTHLVGLGFNGQTPDDLKTKSWMYFPTDRSPFYRMTAFSNYSPYLVNKPYKQWSLLFESAETQYLPDRSDILNQTIDGAINENIIKDSDLDNLATKFYMKADHGYPTPYLTRDSFLNEIEPILRNNYGIYSRGRLGAWRYEVSNQDHSCMQGVEAIDNILFGCEEQTLFYPDHVNSRKETTRRFKL